MTVFYKIASFAVLLCFCLSIRLKAQTTFQKEIAEDGSLIGFSFTDKATQPLAKDAKKLLIRYLQPNKAITFELIKQETDQLGYLHQVFQQYYEGIKVENAIYFVHSFQNKVYLINGDYRPLQNIATIPEVSFAQVITTLPTLMDGKNEKLANNYKVISKGELVVYCNYSEATSKEKTAHVLCHKLEVETVQPHNDQTVYVNALTGELLDKVSNICYFQRPVVVGTHYSGQQTITVDSIAPNRYNLMDSMRNISTFFDRVGIVSSTTRNFSNLSAYDRPALDAHWGAATVWNYWEGVHQRRGTSGSNNLLQVIVHKNEDGFNFANGYYDKRSNSLNLGDNTNNNHSTSLDWIGHEHGHGITNFAVVGDLTYQGESGAINESFSDIWAACIDARNGKNPWLIFDEIKTERSMANPKLFNCPNTYKGQHWRSTSDSYDAGGVHSNSGVMNFWFHVLAVGKTGTNDKGNSYSVAGISIERAERIAFRMYSYLTPNSQYFNMAFAASRAAKDLYGECSPEVASVDNALYAVGLRNQPYQEPFLVFNNPPTEICNGQQKYIYGNHGEENVIYEWHTIGNGLRIVGDSMATPLRRVLLEYVPIPFAPAPLQPRGYRGVSLTAHCRTGKDTQGNWVYGNKRTIKHDIWVGKPDEVGELQTYYPYICGGGGNSVSIDPVAGATSYRWFSTSPALSISDTRTNSAVLTVDRRQRGVREVGFIVLAGNECTVFPQSITDLELRADTYTWRYFTIEVVDDMSCFRVIPPDEPIKPENLTFSGCPNPASSSYTISSGSEQQVAFSYKVFNSVGILLTEGNSENGENTVLQVATWADGIYTVLIQTENGVQTLKLAVQKGNVEN